MRQHAVPSALALLSACGAGFSAWPCPRVMEFPVEPQRPPATELASASALARKRAGVRAQDRRRPYHLVPGHDRSTSEGGGHTAR